MSHNRPLSVHSGSMASMGMCTLALLNVLVALAIISLAEGSCVGKWCSNLYSYQKHKGSCGVFSGCKSKRYKDNDPVYYWCVEVWGSNPWPFYRSTKWDKTRLKRLDGTKTNQRCKNRNDIPEKSGTPCKHKPFAGVGGAFKC